jgi:hypothetical protein
VATFGGYHIVAVGHQDGCCQLTVSAPSDGARSATESDGGGGGDGAKDEVGVRSTRVQFEGPITSLELFELANPSPDGRGGAGVGHPWLTPCVQLVVGCALESAVVYTDVIEAGLADPILLPHSDENDSVLCVRAIKVNFDDAIEVVVGTYGQSLLAYRCSLEDTAGACFCLLLCAGVCGECGCVGGRGGIGLAYSLAH